MKKYLPLAAKCCALSFFWAAALFVCPPLWGQQIGNAPTAHHLLLSVADIDSSNHHKAVQRSFLPQLGDTLLVHHTREKHIPAPGLARSSSSGALRPRKPGVSIPPTPLLHQLPIEPFPVPPNRK